VSIKIADIELRNILPFVSNRFSGSFPASLPYPLFRSQSGNATLDARIVMELLMQE
jgi:hypothetical protein